MENKKRYLFFKNLFDRIFAVIFIIFLLPLMLISYLLACVDTNSNGLFFQNRIGQFGKSFVIFKLKTIHPKTRKISSIGAFFRKTKIDELPQLFNILFGDMSFVGYRPDISGYYDELQGNSRKILLLKPGLLSEASIKYRNEEYLLSKQKNMKKYNDEVIFPDKIKMNLEYLQKISFREDFRIICRSFIVFCK